MHQVSEDNVLGIEKAIDIYGDMLFRVCLIMLKNEADAEDAVQETFLKYIQKAPEFKNAEHEKAWLLKVANNKCKDIFRSRKMQLSKPQIDEGADFDAFTDSITDILAQVPEKFRIVLTLHYVEDYKVKEIAEIIGKTPSAVKMRLQKGRKLIEEKYRKEMDFNGF
ncbi:MAG: RNA polymerase sigma factor [Clostridia bacterium]|nr:RNA polymerase sigma factor [Clostridia bacterium]